MSQPDPNAQSGTGEPQSGGAGEGQATGANGDAGQGAGDNQNANAGQQSAADSVSRADFDRISERMRAADQRAGRAEAELKQLKEKDLPEQEKLRGQLAEVEADRDKAREALTKAQQELAFLKSNKHKWKNPATALKLADLSKVEIDEDGTVRGMDAALEALAKSDPYLLDDSSDNGGNNQKGSTGAPSTGGGKPPSGTSVSALASRIPALRNRTRGTSS